MDQGIGIEVLLDALGEVVRVDKEGQPFLLAVVLNFSRHLAEDFAGIMPRRQRLLLTKYGIQPPEAEVRRLDMNLPQVSVSDPKFHSKRTCCFIEGLRSIVGQPKIKYWK